MLGESVNLRERTAAAGDFCARRRAWICFDIGVGDSLKLLQLVLPLFLVVGAGYGLRRAGVCTEEGDQSLLGILIKLFVPCLALDAIIGNEALARPGNWFFPPLAGFLIAALGYGLCLAAGYVFCRDAKVRRTFASVAGLQNYAYIALPLCMALFERDVVGVLFAFNLGVEVAMWSLGVALVAGGRSGPPWRALVINPPILAVVCALGLNALGVGAWVPVALDQAWHMLGLCAVPLGLLVTGAMLADHATPQVLRSGWSVTAWGILMRLGVLPGCILLAAVFLPLDPDLQAVLVVQAAMPSAVFPAVLAKLYGGDVPTALRVILGTSLLGLLGIPLWLGFGLRLIQDGRGF